jgi:hypothetical protein
MSGGRMSASRALSSVQQTFQAALGTLVEQIKDDRSVLAAILCGSLSHDTVWERSDIDLVLVTVDDKQIEASDISLYADGVNVHAFLMPRATFRKTVEGSLNNSVFHSFLAKGRLLYTHDETVQQLCERLQAIGSRDTEIEILKAATAALPLVAKAHKWFLTRGDLEYTALWILYACSQLAKIEIMSRGQLADREVIPQAIKLNPALFQVIYLDLLNGKKTRKGVQAALDAVDSQLAKRARTIFAPVIEYLRDAGEIRSASDIGHHFTRTLDVDCIALACEYLADEGIIGQASSPARLTKKSNINVEELAFFYVPKTD